MIKAVIFDIGNVLIGWQPEIAFDAKFGEERRRAVFAEVDLHKMNDRVDRGENFHAVLAETRGAYPQFDEELAFWEAHWLDLTGPTKEHSVRLLRALRAAGVPVHALSNFGVETFVWAEGRYPFLREFNQRFISGHMKMAKPDAEIYEAVEAETELTGEALLFIDDRAENIVAAQARGWQWHLFDGADGLAAQLCALGLLSKEQAA